MNALDKATAERFLEDPSSIDLSKYETMSLEATETIAESPDALCLHGIAAFSDQEFVALKKYRGRSLDLSGLSGLDPATASAIAALPAEEIYLDGIGALPDDVAHPLAQSWSKIRLFGLREASDQALENLAAGNAEVDLGSASCLAQRFEKILETSSRVAEKRTRQAERLATELQNTEQDRLASAGLRQLSETTLKNAEKASTKAYSIRIGFLWMFFGGFASWWDRDSSTAWSAKHFVEQLLSRIQEIRERRGNVLSEMHRMELERLEEHCWSQICLLTRQRGHALVGLLKHAVGREHSLTERYFRRREAVWDIRSALEKLDQFLTDDSIIGGSRGAILNGLAYLSSRKSEREWQARFEENWLSARSDLTLSLALAMDRMRAAGCQSEAAHFHQRLSRIPDSANSNA